MTTVFSRFSCNRERKSSGFRTPLQPFEETWLDRFWKLVRTEAGLEDVPLHDTRHSYASMALVGGETIRTVGRLLGHEKFA